MWPFKNHKPAVERIRARTRSLMHSPEGETAREALQRFQTLMAGDVDAYVDGGKLVVINLSASETYVIKSREKSDELAMYAKTYDFPLPAELVTLMCEVGSFQMPVGNSRNYAALSHTWYEGGQTGWSLRDISRMIAWNYGELPGDLFTPDELVHFSREFLFFGFFACDEDGRYSYMFVDRAGRYGVFRYIEDNWPATRRDFIEPIMRGEDARYSLDTLISKLVDGVIVRCLDLNEASLEG